MHGSPSTVPASPFLQLKNAERSCIQLPAFIEQRLRQTLCGGCVLPSSGGHFCPHYTTGDAYTYSPRLVHSETAYKRPTPVSIRAKPTAGVVTWNDSVNLELDLAVDNPLAHVDHQ
ncbi:hypothetical protein RCL1_006349 [Eukaryota sp. TZLM3-RCL]